MPGLGRIATRARSAARRHAVQALYQWQLTRQPWQDIYGQFSGGEGFASLGHGELKDALMQVTGEHEALDRDLAQHSEVALAQIDPVEHAILYLGLWELMHRQDVPYRVVLNESVELAKRFGATHGHKIGN